MRSFLPSVALIRGDRNSKTSFRALSDAERDRVIQDSIAAAKYSPNSCSRMSSLLWSTCTRSFVNGGQHQSLLFCTSVGWRFFFIAVGRVWLQRYRKGFPYCSGVVKIRNSHLRGQHDEQCPGHCRKDFFLRKEEMISMGSAQAGSRSVPGILHLWKNNTGQRLLAYTSKYIRT